MGPDRKNPCDNNNLLYKPSNALQRALAAGKPSLVELRIDPQAITTTTTLDDIRNRARKGS